MKTSKRYSWICATAIVAITFAFPGRLPGQTACREILRCRQRFRHTMERASGQGQPRQPGPRTIPSKSRFTRISLEELNKTKRFQQVIRDGDRKAIEIPNLLVLKTTVVKYTPGARRDVR